MKAAAAVVAAVALLAACGSVAPASAQNVTDVDVLNFALNLEYLEASFYHWAVYGSDLNSTLRGTNGGKAVGGQKANLTGDVMAYATELATDEMNHVIFLRAALGSAAVSMPTLNIGTAFADAADAAFNMTLSPAFNPYANDLFFMHGAFIFEDVGVTAYKGAAALISNPSYLTAAAGILAVEAYHAGLVRNYLYINSNMTVAAYNVTVNQIVDAIAALRVKASGLPANLPDDYGVTVNGTAVLVPTDATRIVYGRTPMQVVSIVTLASTNGTGGFFPDGLNGAINMTLSANSTVTRGGETPSGMIPISVATGAAAPASGPGSSTSGGSAEAPASAPGSSGSPSGSTASTPASAPGPSGGAATPAAGASAAALFLAAAAGASLLLASAPPRPWELRGTGRRGWQGAAVLRQPVAMCATVGGI